MGLTAKTAAMVLGWIFVVVGVVGFIPNPVISETGYFTVDLVHNLIHLASGIVLLIGAYTALGGGIVLKVFGVIYALIAILGLVTSGDMLLDFIHVNAADDWLHVVLAIIILAAGFGLPEGDTA
jgi:hypothetical protein